MEHVTSSSCSCALSVRRRGFSRPASSCLRFLEAPSSFSETGHSCASSPVVHARGFWLLMGIVCLFVAGFWFFFCGLAMLVCRAGAWHPWRGVFFFSSCLTESAESLSFFTQLPSAPCLARSLLFQFSWEVSQLDSLSSCHLCA